MLVVALILSSSMHRALPALPTGGAASAPATGPLVHARPAAPAATGTLVWRDHMLHSDSVMLSMSGLPALAEGQIYTAWLASNERRLRLGTLQLGGGGAARLIYTSPTQDNLLGQYDRVYITHGPASPARTEASRLVLAGRLPAQALRHIRQLLVTSADTPGQLGFALGLRQEVDKVWHHAQDLREAFHAGDFALEQRHAEQLVNIIAGAQGPHFGDLNSDGEIQNSGDGFGLLQNGAQPGYIQGLRDQAQQALDAPDVTNEVKLHVGHVRVTGDNVRVRLTGIRTRALRIIQARRLADTHQDMRTILALAQQAIQGVDMNLDELVGPLAGEGGTLTAYQHAQLMARVTLAPSAPADLAALAPPRPAPKRNKMTITITDDTFTPNLLTVSPGVTVVWQNQGRSPHTVTAVSGAFDSQQIAPGGSFEQTFTEVGTVPYFSLFDGDTSGGGMAGTIIVADPSAAAAPTPGAQAAQHTARALATGSDAFPVVIKDNAFTPSQLAVPVGATVVWTHRGQRTHTVTADAGTFRSQALGGGARFKQTFDRPGTYRYYCEIHGSPGSSGMAGLVIVTKPPTASPLPQAR